jgi:hypothetical protein
VSSPRHQPGIIHLHLFDQHQVWIDKHGREHEIESISPGYAGNIMILLREHVLTLYSKVLLYKAFTVIEEVTLGVDSQKSFDDTYWMLDPTHEEASALSYLTQSVCDQWRQRKGEDLDEHELKIVGDASAWLLSTPLMRALARRHGKTEPTYTLPPGRGTDG